jgi:hypothetical protein
MMPVLPPKEKSLEELITQLRIARIRRLIDGYEVTTKTINIQFVCGTPTHIKTKLVSHIYKRYGYTTHMTTEFDRAVVHLYYR